MAAHVDRESEQARLADMARRAQRSWQAVFTGFLDPVGWQTAQLEGRAAGCRVHTFGGHDDAERRMACFSMENEPPQDWPMVPLEITWDSRFGSAPGHRDILGAALGLGLRREGMGDILMESTHGYLFVTEALADYLLEGLKKAGHTTIGLAKVPWDKVQYLRESMEEKHIIVAALRLDALVAAVYNLSRSQAQKLVTSGQVRIDFVETLHTDARVAEGMLISVRGHGRFRILQTGSTTRKGRLNLVIEKTK